MEYVKILFLNNCTLKDPCATIQSRICTHAFEMDGYDYVCVYCGLLGTPLYAVPKRDF